MTKEERYTIWNRYYQRHKTEINARRKIVRENYKNKLSKAENKIAELEGQVTRAFEVLEGKRKQIEELEHENAELKKRNGKLAGQKASLERWFGEAKDLLDKVLRVVHSELHPYQMQPYLEVLKQAENFLKECK